MSLKEAVIWFMIYLAMGVGSITLICILLDIIVSFFGDRN